LREIKSLGTYRKEGISRSYAYSLFECPECGCHVEKVRKDGINANFCSHACYAKRRERRGAYNEYVVISGYLYVYTPDHPNATKAGYVAKHRLVAEKTIGRLLNKGEDVHHKNLDKYDNDPNNLIAMSSSEHSKLHARLSPINKRRCA